MRLQNTLRQKILLPLLAAWMLSFIAVAWWVERDFQSGLLRADLNADVVRPLSRGFLAMAGLTVGIAILMVLLLRCYVFLPIERMARVLKQHAQGNSAERLVVSETQQDELSDTMRALNDFFDAQDNEAGARLIMEGDLQRSSMFQKSVLDCAGMAIISTDVDGVILLFNPHAEKLLGYKAEELVGLLTPAEFHDADEVAARAASLSEELGYTVNPGFDVFVIKSKLTGQLDAREWIYIRKDKTRVPVSLTVTCLNDDAGKIIGYLGIAIDISEVKMAEERLRRVIESTGNGILMTDANGVILMLNQQTEKMFGYEHGALLGMSVDVLMPLNLRDQHRHHRQLFMSAPTMRSMGVDRSLQAVRSNGELFDVEIGLIPVSSEDGMQVICTIADITLRKQRERELQEAKNAAELAVMAKSEFLAVMSHEIRTPLNGVLGMAQVLARGELNEKQQKQVQTITRSGNALLEILNDILDFSKIEANRLELEIRAVDIKQEMADVVQLMRPTATEKNVALEFHADDMVSGLLMADSTRLRQIVINLLSNAIRFTASGAVSLTLKGREEGGAVHVRLGVQDTGIGIPAEKMVRLFQAFSQADSSTTRQYGGSGLGLVICKRLIEMMGGDMFVESKEGEGSHFWMEVLLQKYR